MKYLNYINPEYIDQITVKRHNELRLGEGLELITDEQQLKITKARYLIIGIPEDLGVRANGGRPGAAKTWDSFLGHFCSLALAQSSPVDRIAVLGSIQCQDLLDEGKTLNWQKPQDQNTFNELITALDHRVAKVIQPLIGTGFIPVVIGGGHNNALGLLKASSKALKQPINCLNIDAHTDLRNDDYRHSGNGFQRAFLEKYLSKYNIFGLHQHTLSPGITEFIQTINQKRQEGNSEHERSRGDNSENPGNGQKIQANKIDCLSLEQWLDTPVIQRHELFQQWVEPLFENHFGLEIDLDVISDMGSSAQSPVGLSVQEVRNLVRNIAGHQNLRYIHLCEGAPELGLYPSQVVKTLSALCLDLMV